MGRSIFLAEDPWVGASADMRRLLAQLKYDAPHVTKVFDICKSLNLQPERPIWRGPAAAHLGIPKRKVAIYFTSFMETERIARNRTTWEREGWKMLAVAIKDVVATPAAELSVQLATALKEIRKT